MTFIAFPDISPPDEQIKFETYPGYEWAYRLTQLFKQLTAEVNSGPPGGGQANITATNPIIVTPSPIKNIGVVSHAATVAPGTYGDANHYTVGTLDLYGHYTSISTLPVPSIFTGNLSLFFGDGSDGAVTLDGVFIPPWATLAATTYTMTDACMCTNLIINNGITLKPVGFTVFARNTLTNNGNIDASGNPGSGIFGGAGFTYQSWWTGGAANGIAFPGNSGGSGTGANGGTSVPNGIGGAGGKGGNAGGNNGGNGGTVTPPGVQFGGTRYAATSLHDQSAGYGSALGRIYRCGAGGGGGAGDGTNVGGGGAGGAAGFIVNANTITGNGTFTAIGGRGSNGSPGVTGGGGGGGGGVIIVLTTTTNYQSTIGVSVAGGIGGAGVGGGSAGDNGGNGRLINLFIVP